MFDVEWLQSALDELTSYWIRANSVERDAITKASDQLEQQLRVSARNLGESRPRGRRIAFFPPLAITFRVEPDGKTVTVLHSRVFWRRK